MSKRDYYEVLGVSRDADAKQLKSAFRKAAMACHPDRHPDDPGAEARFKELNEAYGILSDEQKRAAYDRMGHAAFEGGGMGGGGFQDFGDIFSQIFGGAGGASGFADMFGGRGGRRAQSVARGSDLRYEMEITLEEAFRGKDVEIEVPIAEDCERCDGMGAEPGASVERCDTCGGAGRVRTQQGMFTMERPCPTCGGQGEYVSDPCRECDGQGQVRQATELDVSIPAGVEDGTRIRLSGQGDQAPKRGATNRQRGDLYLFVSVKPHDMFEREGANLFMRAPVPMTVATLGGELELPTIDGGRTKIKIEEGSQGGKRVRLRGKGMSVLRSQSRGDMYVELAVETPSRLSAKQRELLEEFAELSGDEISPESKGFFDKAKAFWDELVD
ncbi:chaperone protein DnaJ [Algimonas ampicilliniresistens]|uniref:Chaperone protein DnaJ n=1 Tax=Algimonas ampicilliniresistens TaxID=1298735 RepID=A0ABQ5VAI5_9PROT|nr:molecular chaperone DnaJ [Algimonas ampicilliniresistens]GLQ23994.1 chaperone protein DnaJ [Algimonas ampicilliniresistens]